MSVPAIVTDALRAYGLDDAVVTFVVDSFNTIYRVDHRFTLRIGPHDAIHTSGSARAELGWTAELAAAGLVVPQVFETRTGTASTIVSDDGGEREAMLLSWVDGDRLTRPPRPGDVTDLGALTARLHDASPPRRRRPSGVLDGRRALLFDGPDRLDDAPPDVSDTHAVLRAAQQRAQRGLDRLWRDAGEPPRILHGDLTPFNLVRTRRWLVPIDFQDMTWGHPQQDVANAIYGFTRDVGVAPALAAFRTAYETVRPWPDFDDDLLADLTAARRLTMVNLAITTRRADLAQYVASHLPALRGYVDG